MREKTVTIVLMPGLNGTHGLFKPLLNALPSEYKALKLSYPTDKKQSYEELSQYVLSEIQTINGYFILLGESFSGPLSIIVASHRPRGLIGIVLSATFVSAPNYKLGRLLPWTLAFYLSKPLYAIRAAFAKEKNIQFIQAISDELNKVCSNVLADRIKSVFNVNVRELFKNIDYPILYLRGKKDYVVPKKNLDTILSLKPQTKVVELDASHFLLQSNPKQSVQAIVSFIETIPFP